MLKRRLESHVGEVILTYQYQSSSLEELLIIPFRMLLFEDVTDPVVLPQPYCSIHHQAWDQTKHLLPNRKLQVLRDVRGIDHLSLSVLHCWWIHFSINHLPGGGRKSTMRAVSCASYGLSHVDSVSTLHIYLSSSKVAGIEGRHTWYFSFPSFRSLSLSCLSSVSP